MPTRLPRADMVIRGLACNSPRSRTSVSSRNTIGSVKADAGIGRGFVGNANQDSFRYLFTSWPDPIRLLDCERHRGHVLRRRERANHRATARKPLPAPPTLCPCHQDAIPDGTGTERPGAVPQPHPGQHRCLVGRLGTDYVDLYQIHRWDDETPVEETMATLH